MVLLAKIKQLFSVGTGGTRSGPSLRDRRDKRAQRARLWLSQPVHEARAPPLKRCSGGLGRLHVGRGL